MFCNVGGVTFDFIGQLRFMDILDQFVEVDLVRGSVLQQQVRVYDPLRPLVFDID